MHEHHQVAHLIEHIKEDAAKLGLNKVSSFTVVMGDLLGFDEESCRMYFDSLGEGTLIDGAKINFVHVPGTLLCRKCNKGFPKVKSNLNCPDCGEQGIPTDIGKEFKAIDLA
ncbi:MAG: hydrogenase maturation nickel metallochaperone HypA [Fibrobacteres bacterium]|nr:hydrogenase maturation nickel metallochaperone HypA [Fibrobacterota bacterium]